MLILKKLKKYMPKCISNRTIEIRVIVFDFDGVIADSVNVKTKAFRQLFKDYPESSNAIEKFHLENGGISRFDKFRHIYVNIIKKELTKKEFERLCADFNKLVVEDVIRAPFIAGAKDFLDSCKGKYPMYVVSATPDEEIREIVGRRGLEGYFKAVYGSPATKAEHINRILKENSYDKEKLLFIGDSINDYKASYESGVLFAARVDNKKESWLRAAKPVVIFSSFEELTEYIK